MRIKTKILIGSMSIAAMVASGSCATDITCGTGTIEKDGECIASGTPIHGNCGAGSTFNPATQQCEITACGGANPCGVCGPNTTPETDASGHTTCVGTGGGNDLPCDMELPCPSAGNLRQMICGRLVDTETSAYVEGDDLPTTVKISFYDALAFAGNTSILPEFSVAPDKCGRYVSADAAHAGVSVPGTMFILVGTDDATTNDNFATTGVALSGASRGQAKRVNTYLTRQATDAAWSASAGLTGPSFVQQGVFLGIFLDKNHPGPVPYDGTKGKPTPGVTVTVAGGAVAAPDKAYYFSDATALVRSSLGTGTSTGADGAVLVTRLSPDLAMFGGTGPTGCIWLENPAATIPNTVFVVEREGTCP